MARNPILVARAMPVWAVEPKAWPPHEVYKMDTDASRWHQQRDTRSLDLLGACSYFITSGWPVEALDDFLDSIIPTLGWIEEWPEQFHDAHLMLEGAVRDKTRYGRALDALMVGYWKKQNDHTL